MTAIFGIIQHNQSAIPSEPLEAAAKSLRHHAEHGLDTWQAAGVALGQALTRFWANSAHSPQPERDPARGLTLVADARLDNRAELAEQLGIARADLADILDSRLLLCAYRAWGEDCPRRLLGDFVFAVWDERKRSLFLARDPIGIRWLYFANSPGRFSFASDPAGLLDLMDEVPRVNLRSLDEFLTFPYNVASSRTFYENVTKLQPGEALKLEGQQIQTWRYWRAEDIQPNPDFKDPRQGIETLRGLLREAVAYRAETVDRLGSHMSGGLDSSALTALSADILRKAGRPDPLAFSWSPPLEMRPLLEKDERVYVERIANHLNIPAIYTHVPPKVDILHEISDPSILPLNTVRYEQTVMENARQRDVRVLLSGWGGDELIFSRGIGYPSGLIRQGRFLALARYLKNQYGWNPKRWVSGLYTHGLYPLLPEKWQIRLHLNLRKSQDLQSQAVAIARQQNMFSLPSPEFFQPEFCALLERNHQKKFQWIQPGLRNSQRWYLEILLSRIESWAAWSARLGARHAYPLLDRRVVEFALSIPEDWIYYGGKLREFGKQAVSDVLPSALFDGRDKQDRALAAHQKTIEHKWEVNQARLQIFETHRKTNPPAAQWLNFDYIQRVLLEPPSTLDHPRPQDAGPALPRRGIWQALNLAFLDRRAVLPEEK